MHIEQGGLVATRGKVHVWRVTCDVALQAENQFHLFSNFEMKYSFTDTDPLPFYSAEKILYEFKPSDHQTWEKIQHIFSRVKCHVARDTGTSYVLEPNLLIRKLKQKLKKALTNLHFVSASSLLCLTSTTQAVCMREGFCKNVHKKGCREILLRTWWGLTEVPRDIPDGTQGVGLQHNQINSLSPGDFTTWTIFS